MIVVHEFKNRTVAILGLGRTGLSAAASLRAGGARVVAWDDDGPCCAAARAEKIDVRDYDQWDWSVLSALVVSPGIPLRFPAPHPAVVRALAAGVEVLGDVDLMAGALAAGASVARLVGVTGTNGKSTTTALVGQALAASGRAVQVGANLGVPVLSLDPIDADGTYVLEMSSYQLDLTEQARFDVAVLLNLSPDHLDRHGSMANYAAAKRRIFRGQGSDATAIVGIDDQPSRDIWQSLQSASPARVIPISAHEAIPGGVYARDGRLIDDRAGLAEDMLDLRSIDTLPGAHNWQNAAAAYAVLTALGIPARDAAHGLTAYSGLPHRMERIATLDGVTYINDSKATNAVAAARALACAESIYWIAGGRGKDESLDVMAPYFNRVRHAFLIGEAAAAFAAALDGHMPVTVSGDLATAVAQAAAQALDDEALAPTVLLSPACASFDQFRDFEERGEVFRRCVEALAEGARPSWGGPAGQGDGMACMGAAW